MSDDYSRIFNIVGIAFNLVGVLILFRWGMPFRVETHGLSGYVTENTDMKEIALDHIYVICGYFGLGFLILGSILQIVSALMPPVKL